MTYDYNFSSLDLGPLPVHPEDAALARYDEDAEREERLAGMFYLAVPTPDGLELCAEDCPLADIVDGLLDLARAFYEVRNADGLNDARQLRLVRGARERVVYATAEGWT